MAAVTQPVTAACIGASFVKQYYLYLRTSPGIVCNFYQDRSKLARLDDNGCMSFTTSKKAIKDKILALSSPDVQPVFKSIDSYECGCQGISVIVIGSLNGQDNSVRDFVHSFFLAPQENGGYFVLNDIFRCVDGAPVRVNPSHDISVPCTPLPERAAQVSDKALYQALPDQVTDLNKSIESSPPSQPVTHKPPFFAPLLSAAATNEQVSRSESLDNGNNPKGEADGYVIHVSPLQKNTTTSMLEKVFEKFGTIKSNGIEVWTQNKSCYAFVTYEEESSASDALKASTVRINGNLAYVTKKQFTNNRVNPMGGSGSGSGRGRGSGRGSGSSRGSGNRGWSSNR